MCRVKTQVHRICTHSKFDRSTTGAWTYPIPKYYGLIFDHFAFAGVFWVAELIKEIFFCPYVQGEESATSGTGTCKIAIHYTFLFCKFDAYRDFSYRWVMLLNLIFSWLRSSPQEVQQKATVFVVANYDDFLFNLLYYVMTNSAVNNNVIRCHDEIKSSSYDYDVSDLTSGQKQEFVLKF